MLTISRADVVADPFPHVIKQDILPPAFFEALKADFPRTEAFEEQRQVNGASGSRTGTGFDFYRGDGSYSELTGRSEAWGEFDAYVNSERFADMSAANLGSPSALRVDGGMVVNDLFCQWLADLTGRPIERPAVVETTALGAAYLAGVGAGLYASLDEVAAQWRCERRFEPKIGTDERDARYAGWQDAVHRVLTKRER